MVTFSNWVLVVRLVTNKGRVRALIERESSWAISDMPYPMPACMFISVFQKIIRHLQRIERTVWYSSYVKHGCFTCAGIVWVEV